MFQSWMIFGLLLMGAELILPGAIVVFLGLAALFVSACLYFGLISGWVSSLTMWFISSLVLILALRNVAQKFVQGDVALQNTDEDLDAFGAEAKVIEDIRPGMAGRIDFRGSSWKATCYEGHLEPGVVVQVLSREGMCWIVEAVEVNTQTLPEENEVL